MRLPILIIAFAFLVGNAAQGQQNLEENEALREVFTDGEYFFASEDYADALIEYQKLYLRGFQDNAHINYKLGICYLNIPGQKEKAIEHLQVAAADVSKNYRESSLRETDAPYDAFIYLGNAYRVDNQLEQAIQAYTKYKELLPKDDVVNIEYTNKQIENCKNAVKYMENPVNLERVNVGRPVNNASSNFRPAISGDGQSMVYMNSLPFYDALYYTTYDAEDEEWNTPTNITPQVQSDGDQYATALNYDGTVLFLSRDDDFNSDILVSELEDGTWTRSRPLNREINTKFWESHASVSKDGKSLYFASNRNGTLGEMDIFMSMKNEDGEWGPPENLGDSVNTHLNEDTPFITPDGKRLYFSSQGHFNIGGYDIFFSEKKEDGTWSTPVNMGYPVNTTDDDLFYVPMNERLGYMAIYSDEGMGREDIYKYQLGLGEVEITEDEVEPVLPEEEKQTAELTEEVTEASEDIAEEVEVPEPKEYTATPVLFAFDDASLSEEAKKMLNKIAGLLEQEPSILITAKGYTDDMGPETYNQMLSEKRAEAIVDYLAGQGIEKSRMTAEGKGETAFIAVNTSIDSRHFNRRVEIEFKETPDHIIIVKPSIVPESLRP
ncbi:MAG: OmpA family protein [Bacteroidota bacterium]